jgi:hypothetical protein
MSIMIISIIETSAVVLLDWGLFGALVEFKVDVDLDWAF